MAAIETRMQHYCHLSRHLSTACLSQHMARRGAVDLTDADPLENPRTWKHTLNPSKQGYILRTDEVENGFYEGGVCSAVAE